MLIPAEKTHVVTGLVAKRAEIAGKIEYAQIELRRMIADLDSIDASIRIFAPDLATETIKPRPAPPQHQALRGVVKATIYDVLRDAEGPVTSETLAYKLMEERNLPKEDDRIRKLFISRVCAALFILERRGEVRKVGGKIGRFMGWELVPLEQAV